MWIAIQNAIGARQGVGGGPGPGPGYTPPLDAYSNTILAYSVRKLSSTYSGPCIQVRRASDGLTQDIGFDSNGLIATADIASFCSGSVGTVAVWYDQGSLGQNATQSNPLKQPTVYSGTDFFYLGEVPSIQALGTEEFNFSITHSGNWTNLMVMAPSSGSGDSGWTYGNSGGAGIGSINAGTTEVFLYYGAVNSILGDSRSQNLYSLFFDNSGIDWFRNAVGNTGVGSGVSGFSWDTFMSRRVSDTSRQQMQEFLMWDTDLISSQEILETNLNDYYQITNLPYYSSGFLADYPGAAAAYSVRKLSNTAIKCMRVRRAVAPFDEQDIGFTAGGDLDEAAIVAFGGSDSLTVSVWFDQSGSQNHATQITAGNQPQIYNGTAVITENGKPAINFAQDGFTAITGSKSNILFHQAAGGLAMCVINPTPNTLRLCIIAETNGTSSNKKGFVFGWDDRATSPGNDNGYYSLTVGTGAPNAIIASQEASFVGAQTLMAIEYDWDAGIFQYQDGSLLDSITTAKTPATGDATNDLSIGSIAGNNAYGLTGTMQELILWNAHDTNRTGIETNINDYFSIY